MYPKKPVERRSLWCGKSVNSQGSLELWVDILTPEQASRFKMWDIALPPPEEVCIALPMQSLCRCALSAMGVCFLSILHENTVDVCESGSNVYLHLKRGRMSFSRCNSASRTMTCRSGIHGVSIPSQTSYFSP